MTDSGGRNWKKKQLIVFSFRLTDLCAKGSKKFGTYDEYTTYKITRKNILFYGVHEIGEHLLTSIKFLGWIYTRR